MITQSRLSTIDYSQLCILIKRYDTQPLMMQKQTIEAHPELVRQMSLVRTVCELTPRNKSWGTRNKREREKHSRQQCT